MAQTIIWTNNITYTRKEVSRIVGVVKSFGSIYMPLTEEEYQKMVSYSSKLGLPTELVFKIRNQARIQSEVENTSRLRAQLPRITEELYSIQSDAHLTPTENSVLIDRRLRNLNVPVPIIMSIFRSDITLEPLYQSNYIQTLIANTTERETAVRERASAYERTLENFLRRKGVSFQTEEELRLEGKSNTPDILLRQPLRIVLEGVSYVIHWIDAKDSTLVNFPFIVSKLRKQAARYTKEFGQGALVFSGGLDSSIKIPGTILLEGNPSTLEQL